MKLVKTVGLVALSCLMFSMTVSAQVHFSPVESTGVPYAIVVQEATWNGGASLVAGDEIAVFDGNTCVGAAVVSGFPVNLTAWERDTNLNLPGFTPGHKMTYKLWDQSQNEEQPALAHYDTGNALFGSGFASAVTLNSSDFPVLLSIWSNEATIPSTGGTLTWGAQLWSTVGVTRTGLRFWTTLTRPSGFVTGTQFQYPFNLAPFMNIANSTLNQNIEASWPSGTWTMNGHVGIYPNAVIVDHFTFEKLAADPE